MKRNRFWLSAAMAIILAVVGSIIAPSALFTQTSKPAKKAAKFSKVGNKTKIDAVHLAQGDTLTWSDPNSDLFFYFMDATLFGVESQSVRKGGTLRLAVQAGAKNGSYHYSIFRLADTSFVVGNSPPTIIIP